MSNEESDKALLRQLAAGHLQALDTLYERYALGMYHYLWATLGSEADAEDALQEIFLALVRMGRRAARIDNLRTYLLVAARNQAASLARRRSVEQRGLERLAQSSQETSERPETALAWHVQEALRQLPAEQREVVVLKIWQEMTFREIAGLLDISPNTAASRYRYAIAKLREILGGMFDEPR